MASTGLEEFKDVLGSFQDLSSLAIKGTVALPLLNLWARLGPPPSVAVSTLTSAAEFVAVIWAFHFWHDYVQSSLERRMRASIAIFCFTLLAAGVLLEEFTIRPTADGERIVFGYVLRPDVKPLLSASYTESEALRDAQFDPQRVWQPWSITVVHLGLIICWIAAFVALGMFVSSFIILQRRRQTAAPVS